MKNKRLLKKAIVLLVTFFVVGATAFAGLSGMFGPSNALETIKASDNPTYDNWKTQFNANDINNVGRIWTDKSVFDTPQTIDGVKVTNKADFQVALSALGSASNTMTKTTMPLDVVMVLDVSGSMTDPYGSKKMYIPQNNVNEDNRYYVFVNGKYESVEYKKIKYRKYGWVDSKSQAHTPKTKDTPNGEQFYEYKTPSKLESLQVATNSFIESVYGYNEKIVDPNKQHRISLVQFGADSSNSKYDEKWNDTITLNDLTVCDKQGKEQLQNSVNNLSASGWTQADKGLKLAAEQLNKSSRKNDPKVKKVVIFFTDGEPNEYDGFWPKVAANAVNTAKTIKQTYNADVYSVGLFKNAYPDRAVVSSTKNDTEKFNLYMHAVSSNYKDASSKSEGNKEQHQFTVTLGKRTPDKQFYKAVEAGKADLDVIFQSILKESASESGYVTDVTKDASAEGFISINDPIGPFMEVKSVDSLIFNGKEYKITNPQGDHGSYTVGSHIVDTGIKDPKVASNLEDVIIEVTNSADGQVIEMKVPASCLPLCYFNIDGNANTVQFTERTPIRLLFSVGLKDDVKAKIENGTYVDDPELLAYIQDNTGPDGELYFYSNNFDKHAIPPKGGPEYTKAGTHASFVPAETNEFYYVLEDSLIYEDEKCTKLATNLLLDHHYYYIKHEGYDITGDKITPIEKAIQWNSDGLVNKDGTLNSKVEKQGNNYIIKKGTVKNKFLFDLNVNKTENITNTAKYSMYPYWHAPVAHLGHVDVWLGNDGRLTYPNIYASGKLALSKTVINDVTSTAFDNELFTFNIKLDKTDVNGQFVAKVDGKAANAVQFTKGEASVQLKHGQTMEIYGIPANAKYTITEVNSKGFTPDVNPVTGTIAAGATVKADFTNKYTPEETTLAKANKLFKVQKTLSGRPLKANDEFTFTLAAKGKAPLPVDTELVLKGSEAQKGIIEKTFGDITFDQVGTYEYYITENAPAKDTHIDGSSVKYLVTVDVVVDDVNHELKVNKVSYAVVGGTGEYTDAFAKFENSYNAQPTKAHFDVTKKLTGRTMYDTDTFKFKLIPDDKANPMPTQDELTLNGLNGKDSVKGQFGDMTFNKEGTFTYTIKELDTGIAGVTTSQDVYKVTVKVTKDAVSGNLKAAVSYVKVGSDQPVSEMAFTNTYSTSVIVGPKSEDKVQINVKKELVGREWLSSDKFTFTLVGKNGAPLPSDYNSKVKNEVVITAEDLAKGYVKAFENIEFTSEDLKDVKVLDGKKVKVYTYTISEETPANVGGLTLPKPIDIQVTVTDDLHGKMTAKVSPDPVTFVNTYSSEIFVGGDEAQAENQINIKKNLVGRDWLDTDEFVFSIVGEEGAPKPDVSTITITKADAQSDFTKLFANIKFTNKNLENEAAENGKITKTYTYTVTEQTPVNAGGLTLPEAQTVTIVVTDHLDGTMTAKINPQTLTFTNTYHSEIVIGKDKDTQMSIVKDLQGRAWQDGDSFEFNIVGKNKAPTPAQTKVVINNASKDHKVVIGNITITNEDMAGAPVKGGVRVKDFVYAIQEVKPSNTHGITYDGATKEIVVTVTDHLDGKMTATVKPQSVTFVNTYNAKETQVQFDVSKHLDGRAMYNEDSFKFELVPSDKNNPMPADKFLVINGVVGEHDAAAQFGKIAFNKAGKYEYTIKEIDTKISGVTVSSEEYKVTVDVTRNPVSGDYEATEKYAKVGSDAAVTKATFTNVYSTEIIVGGKDAETKQQISVVKDLVGRDWLDSDKFEFVVSAHKDTPHAPLPADPKVAVTKANQDHLVLLNNIKIETKDLDHVNVNDEGKKVATFKYVIKEVVPTETNNVVYDKGEKIVTVEVTDDLHGKMTAKVNPNQVTFKNVYSSDIIVGGEDAEADLQLSLVKDFKGRPWVDGDSFEFTVSAETPKAPVPENPTVVITDKTAAHKSLIGNIHITNKDLEGQPVVNGQRSKDFTYVVKETVPTDKKGIAYDAKEQKFTVHVVDDMKGNMSATISVQSLTFKNTYNSEIIVGGDQAEKDVQINVAKNLVGRDWLSNDKFVFTITGEKGAPLPKDFDSKVENTVVIEAKDADHMNLFGNIKFTNKDLEDKAIENGVRTKEYVYTVTEETPVNAKGMTLAKPQTVKVIVTDHLDGTMTAKVEPAKLTFTNTYSTDIIVGGDEASSDTQVNIVKDLSGREWLAGDSFEFTIVADKSNPEAPAPDSDTIVITDQTKAHKAFIGNIHITSEDLKDVKADANGMKTATYKYMITEKVPADKHGITYATEPQYIIVTVHDDSKGNMTATVDHQTLTFKNAYGTDVHVGGKEAKAEAQITVKKNLVGREWLDSDQFDFIIAADKDNPNAPLPKDKRISLTKNKQSSLINDFVITSKDLEDVEIKNGVKTQTFKYVITEDVPTDTNGLTYASDPQYVIVTVVDDLKGHMTATVDNQLLTFNNVYGTNIIVGGDEADAQLQINLKKKLDGRKWLDSDKFEFVISVHESTPNAPLPDKTKVVITDKTKDHQSLIGNIVVSSEDLANDPRTVVNDKGEKQITYKYVITETVPADRKGIAYAGRQVVTVVVTDDLHGHMGASVSSNQLVFTNIYTPGEVIVGKDKEAKISIAKKLTGRVWEDFDEFTFNLTPVTVGAPMPKDAQVVITKASAADAKGNRLGVFDDIIVTSDHMKDATVDTHGYLVKDFVYKVTEVAKNDDGITYDTKDHRITITVVDDHQGQLKATASGELVFENIYEPSSNYKDLSHGGLNLAKVLNGRDMNENQFAFTIKAANDAAKAKLESEVLHNTAVNDSAKSVMTANEFNKVVYTAQDVDKEFKFVVSENKPDMIPNGYEYDNTQYELTIKITDNHKGKLGVITTVKDMGEFVNKPVELGFTNKYYAEGILGASGHVQIKANKTLNGRPIAKDEFKFEVRNAKNDAVVATGTNGTGKPATITFTDIKYTVDSLKADYKANLVSKKANTYTYEYVVYEVNDLPGNVANQDRGFSIFVKVTDSGSGKLDILVEYPDGKDALAFTNQYNPKDVKLRIAGTKALSFDKPSSITLADIANKFEFNLAVKEVKGNGEILEAEAYKDVVLLPENTVAKNDASGNVEFGEMTYTNAIFEGLQLDYNTEGKRSVEITYVVTESQKVAGITNDATPKEFTVTVVDDKNISNGATGEEKPGLSCTHTGDDVLFTFVNKYSYVPKDSSVTDPTDSNITITKKLTGRELFDDEFEFLLTDTDGEIVAKGHNDADGKVVMSNVRFDTKGNYEFILKELVKSDDGVTYDSHEYPVTAFVEDNKDGTLSVKWRVGSQDIDKDLVFNNEYNAAPTYVTLSGVKYLENREMKEGEFSFVLKDENGEILQIKEVNADGSIVFDEIKYEEDGEYNYTIQEVIGTDEEITYDSKVYNVTVKVVDDLRGHLGATIITEDGPIVFANIYTKKEEPKPIVVPKPQKPTTSDDTEVAPWLFLATVSGLALVGATRRRRYSK